MKLRTLLPIAALGIVAIACAQDPVRTFKYTSFDAADGNYSAAGNTRLKVVTDVNVGSYLYITGNLGANWVVNGWGKGSDTEVNQIKFYHTETLTLVCDAFDNPEKIQGTRTGAQSIALRGQFGLYNDKTGARIYDSGMVPIDNLNEMFTASGPNFQVAQTNGVLRLQFGRQITITPTVGPGVYENVGKITIVRN